MSQRTSVSKYRIIDILDRKRAEKDRVLSYSDMMVKEYPAGMCGVKDLTRKMNPATVQGVLTNENAILEIKCFPSLARNIQDIETAAKEGKMFPIILQDGVFKMNKNHSYYYQVQGQLRITKMAKCYFVCFITQLQPITVVEVDRDENFIQEMVPKLVSFYKECILPEIILRRLRKNAKCYDPTNK